MMFSNKEDKKDFSGKKYLLVIVVLILIAALGLSIAGMMQKEESIAPKNNTPALDTELEIEADALEQASYQSYATEMTPTLQAGDKILGSTEARLKVFVYEDYADILSAKFSQNISALLDSKGVELSFVVRPFISSAKSAENALALECAAESDKWQSLRVMMFSALLGEKNIATEAELDEEIMYYAKELGLDTEAFAACLTNQQKSGKIEQLAEAASSYRVQGSPTIFIGDEMILGARPLDDYSDSNGDRIEGMKSVIRRFLAK